MLTCWNESITILFFLGILKIHVGYFLVHSKWFFPLSLSRHVLPGWMLKGWILKLSLKLQHSNNIHVNFRPTMVYLCLIFYSILIDFFVLRCSLKDKTGFIVINHTCGETSDQLVWAIVCCGEYLGSHDTWDTGELISKEMQQSWVRCFSRKDPPFGPTMYFFLLNCCLSFKLLILGLWCLYFLQSCIIRFTLEIVLFSLL